MTSMASSSAKQHDVVRHLQQFVESQIRDLGKRHARGYLRRCIDHWRVQYGDDVATDMERRIRALWEKA